MATLELKSFFNSELFQSLCKPHRPLDKDFLENYCGDKRKFHVEESLFNSDLRIVMSAFSSLIDCEGSIDWYGLKRVVRIRMRNKEYLRQWKKLLEKYGIYSKFRKNKNNEWELNLAGWQDFNRLNELGFRMYHSHKLEKWMEMLKGFKRNQISRNSYKKFYMDKLRELNKKVTSKELSDYIKKSKRVTNHYLLKLEKQKLVSCDRKSWPHLYFISTSSVR